LWISTHSVGFLNALQSELSEKVDIINFSDANFDSSVILSPIKKDWRSFRKAFDVAIDDLSDLTMPKSIYYCEGRPEPFGPECIDYGLDAEVYNLIFGESRPDVLFVSSGGSTVVDKNAKLPFLVFSKVASSIKIFILKDMDINSSGNATTIEQRTNWLSEALDYRRMLKRREIENYLFDPEILKSYRNDIDLSLIYDSEIIDVNIDAKSKLTKILLSLDLQGKISGRELKLNLARHIKEGTKVFEELSSCIF